MNVLPPALDDSASSRVGPINYLLHSHRLSGAKPRYLFGLPKERPIPSFGPSTTGRHFAGRWNRHTTTGAASPNPHEPPRRAFPIKNDRSSTSNNRRPEFTGQRWRIGLDTDSSVNRVFGLPRYGVLSAHAPIVRVCHSYPLFPQG